MKFGINQSRFNSSYYEVVTETDGCTSTSGLLNRDELISIIKKIQDEILGPLKSSDHAWWIEAIRDEIERAGYRLVKVEEE